MAHPEYGSVRALEKHLRAIEASWVWSGDPAAPPIASGAVIFDPHGRVVEIGPASSLRARDAVWERHEGVLIPGLVNARVSLELSGLSGMVPGGKGYVPWVTELMRLRAALERERDQAAIESAVTELALAGTAAIGDVSRTLASVGPLSRAPLVARVHQEIAGVRSETAEVVRRIAEADAAAIACPKNLTIARAPHSLIGLAPGEVAALRDVARAPMPLKLSFSEAERAYLEDGSGAFAEWLREIGADAPDWPCPGLSPVDCAAAIGALGPAVACTHLSDARPHELRALAVTRTLVVLCPRASAHVELKLPPLDEILDAGLEPGLGTDSLACAISLDVLDDASALHQRFAHVPPAAILAMATSWGARALGLEHLVGSFAEGRVPGALLFPGTDLDDPLAHVLTSRARKILVQPGSELGA